MNIRDALKNNIQTSQMVCGAYLGDLSDEEAMQRPHPQCNHINWQVGHIIASENQMASHCVAGSLPELPAGFAEKYTRETNGSDNPDDFVPLSQLKEIAKTQTDAVLEMIDGMAEDDFAKPAPEAMQSYAATNAAIINMIGSHWMMHAGQWVVLRRQLGRDIVI